MSDENKTSTENRADPSRFCQHISLRFDFGGTGILCTQCDRIWQAMKNCEICMPDVERADYALGPNDIREMPPGAGPILPPSPSMEAMVKHRKEFDEAMAKIQQSLKQLNADIKAPQPKVRVTTEQHVGTPWTCATALGFFVLVAWIAWLGWR